MKGKGGKQTRAKELSEDYIQVEVWCANLG